MLDARSYAVIAAPGTASEAAAALGLAPGSAIVMRQGDPALFGDVVARYHGGGAASPSDGAKAMGHAMPAVAQ